jgi:polyhydroxyalkanoate synthesis regulator phasin
MPTFESVERKYREINDMLTEIYNDYKKGEITAQQARDYVPMARMEEVREEHSQVGPQVTPQQREMLKSLNMNMNQTRVHIRGLQGGRRKKTLRRKKTRRNHKK